MAYIVMSVQGAELLVVLAHPFEHEHVYMYTLGHQWATTIQVLS